MRTNDGHDLQATSREKTILTIEQAEKRVQKCCHNLEDCDVLIANATKIDEVNVVRAAKELKAAFAKTPMEMAQVTDKIGSLNYAFWHCIITGEKQPGSNRCSYIRRAVAWRGVKGYLEWKMMQPYDMAEIIKAPRSRRSA